MASFWRYPDAAQECICKFFTLDGEDVSAPQHNTMLQMLCRTFVLPRVPTKEENKRGKQKEKDVAAAATAAAGAVAAAGNGEEAEVVSTQGCCVIS